METLQEMLGEMKRLTGVAAAAVPRKLKKLTPKDLDMLTNLMEQVGALASVVSQEVEEMRKGATSSLEDPLLEEVQSALVNQGCDPNVAATAIRKARVEADLDKEKGAKSQMTFDSLFRRSMDLVRRAA